MGISMWQLGIILLIVVLLFGTKRLKSIGGDLGGAIKGFKKAMNDENQDDAAQAKVEHKAGEPIDTTTADKKETSQ